eukprot:SAG11_NODE_207_length_12378_cov_8.404105_4_plen_128_part_00
MRENRGPLGRYSQRRCHVDVLRVAHDDPAVTLCSIVVPLDPEPRHRWRVGPANRLILGEVPVTQMGGLLFQGQPPGQIGGTLLKREAGVLERVLVSCGQSFQPRRQHCQQHDLHDLIMVAGSKQTES